MKIFDDLSREQEEIIKYYVTKEKPFGPENASQVKDPLARWLLFNQHNALCAEYRKDPNIIIGRRGSGKTSIISNTKNVDTHTYIVNISPYELIGYVKHDLFSGGDSEDHYVETVSKFWDILLNTTLMSYVCTKINDNALLHVRKYLATSKIETGSNITAIVNALKKNAPKSDGRIGFFVSAFIDFIDSKDSFYEVALLQLSEYMEKKKETSVLIIDSIEDYKLSDDKNKAVISGLLKCAGEYGDQYRQIRLCIPGEAYFDIRACSSNPLKDFTKNLLLQWLPVELFSMIAWKYVLYCRLHDFKMYKEISVGDFSDRKFVLSVIARFLGNNVINGLKVSEPTLPYIMRHTQLLPRQLILILNRIFGSTEDNRESVKSPDDAHIVASIKHCESILCEEIFSAFKYKYPDISTLCQRCIPELPRIFNNGLLQQVYTRHGKGILKAQNVYDFVEQTDFNFFKRALVEMGIVGRIKNKTEIYAVADFEYAQAGRLNMSVDDEMCLHPIFSGEFESSKNSNGGLFIYPQKDLFDLERGRNLRVSV